ncbi:Eukaryotic translation initiation factor 3 subunit H [Cryoendolithus antarcticus]|uniref:Eukaryotic translation initiation factor 3 subunit H n=1 Tax=Cryoendolithus antarcticus TaxID=1507870 RepID=A0A1V8T0H1_9PEZI|nr:Eukaryotic translation initiation factor 3 subunit H [Cryoendolithus antarcticus]
MANATSQGTPTEAQIEALVVMRIIKHASSTFPTTATGCLVGMDVGNQLQITNSFPFPAAVPDPSAQQDSYHTPDPSTLALAAPRAKSNVTYQNEMVKLLREVNVDAQNVGWYMSASMGNFVSAGFVENQFFYQKAADEKSLALVFDVSRSSAGGVNMKAYRLSPSFMAAYKEGKFNTESLQKSNLRFQDILLELPLKVHNSHLLTSLLHTLPNAPPSNATLPFPTSLASLTHNPDLTPTPLAPNFDALDLSIDPFLEKTCDLLLDSIEAHTTEQNNFQYWQRATQREQTKVSAWQVKRKAENAARTAAGQPALDENEWTKLFKLPVEPSRLEALLVGRQVEQYARQVDGFGATVSGKMFGVRGSLLPGNEA